MAQLAGLIGLPISLALLVYAIFAPRSKQDGEKQVGKFLAIVMVVTEFLGVFTVSWLSVGLWAWILIYGDNPPRLYAEFNLYIAVSLAALVSGLTAWRVFTSRANKRYIRIHLYGSLGLLFLLVTTFGTRQMELIDGTSPRSAAESVLDRVTFEDYEVLTLMESESLSFGNTTYRPTQDRKLFVILGRDEPRGRIVVSRYMKFFWTVSRYETFELSTLVLDRAKARLNGRTQIERMAAPNMLRDIIRKYPSTSSAIEAQEILDSLEVEN